MFYSPFKVEDLKRKIQAKTLATEEWDEFKFEHQRLIFEGRPLQNNQILRSIARLDTGKTIQLARSQNAIQVKLFRNGGRTYLIIRFRPKTESRSTTN